MDYKIKYNNALDRAMNLFVTNNISATAVCKIFPELNESEEVNYEKKYKEALEWMQSLYSGLHGATKEEAEHYFPELKESEDEKIKREIVAYINELAELKSEKIPTKWLAWLEKQGEKNPADKITPKFKVGDFITNDYCLGKVIGITNDAYLLDTGQGVPFSCEHNAHLWTIKDAKDGDVLMTTKTRNCPFIYRKTDYNNNLAYYYAGVDGNGDFCEGCLKRTMYHFGSVADITPATKEQRDLLFKKMKEAGYEWDGEKKELKKIEPKKLDADKVIEWMCNNTEYFWNSPYTPNGFINQFKKDFGL